MLITEQLVLMPLSVLMEKLLAATVGHLLMKETEKLQKQIRQTLKVILLITIDMATEQLQSTTKRVKLRIMASDIALIVMETQK